VTTWFLCAALGAELQISTNDLPGSTGCSPGSRHSHFLHPAVLRYKGPLNRIGHKSCAWFHHSEHCRRDLSPETALPTNIERIGQHVPPVNQHHSNRSPRKLPASTHWTAPSEHWRYVACFSGNTFHLINEVILRWAGLVLGRVTACGQANHFSM